MKSDDFNNSKLSDNLKEKKSISQSLAEFSKRLNEAKVSAASKTETEDGLIKKVKSPLSSLQDQINEREEERTEFLQKQFLEFTSPLTQDIEKDEEELLKAYNLFCQIHQVNQTTGDSKTHLKDLSITAPLCKKSEYSANPNRFSLLKLWFITQTQNLLFVPSLEQTPEGAFLLFTEKDLWKPSLFEKEVLQAVNIKLDL